MAYQELTKEELIEQLRQLKEDNNHLKTSYLKSNTERQLADNKFQMLFEQSLVGMALVDHETGQFTAVNQSMLNSIGYSEDELLKLSFWDITPIEYRSQEFEQLDQLNNTSKFGPHVKEYIRKDGTRYPISLSGAMYIDSDGKKLVWGIIQDITEQVRAEKTIASQNAQLQKLNQDKDRFITIIAHDLKSPFANVLGLLNLLTESVATATPAENEELVALINQAANNAANLLDDLLNWVKASSNAIKCNPEIISFNTLFSQSIDSLLPNALKKKITITTLAKDESNVFGDRNILKTVLRNIISNSIKYTKNQGTISVAIEQNNFESTITVHDNGIGMTAETLSLLFDYSNLNTINGTEDENGTGLGLLICKELIEKQGGKIWAESEIGKGTKVKFTLPLQAFKNDYVSEPRLEYN